MTLSEQTVNELNKLQNIGDSVKIECGTMRQISVYVCRFNQKQDLIIKLKNIDGVPTAIVVGKSK